jgi:hypothetical protein
MLSKHRTLFNAPDAKAVPASRAVRIDKLQPDAQTCFILLHFLSLQAEHFPTFPVSFKCCANRVINCYKVSARYFYTLQYISNKAAKQENEITLFRAINHLYLSFTL